MCSPYGRNNSGITIALTAKSIIGAEGTNVLALNISTAYSFLTKNLHKAPAFALAISAKCW